MRYRLLLALLVASLAVSAHGARAQPAESVLVDAVLWVVPPSDEGLCLSLGAGTLTVTTRRVKEASEQRPTSFRLNGFMIDPDANLTVSVSRQETTATTHLNGSDHYCWSVSADAPETRDMPMAQRGAYAQQIAVRLVFRPD